MTTYSYNGYTSPKVLLNTSLHIESSISQKRDIDANFTLYVPSGYQRTTINSCTNNGVIVNDGEIFVL